MNWNEALTYEARRREIGKHGSKPKKTTGALVPFTAQLKQHQKVTETFKKDYDVGRQYAKDHHREKPLENLTAEEESRVSHELKEQLITARVKDAEFQELGEYIACKTGTTWIRGPIKELGGRTHDRGAFQKTVKDYLLDWTSNKDLIRGTVAAEDKEDLFRVVARVDIICSPVFGMTLVKRQEQTPNPKKGCGYSGWNFAVVMKGSPIVGEIQANTYSMMYAKMSKVDYTKAILGGNEAKYTETANRMKFEGGLQHLFYEIYQSNFTTKGEKEAASALSRQYCDLARMHESSRGGSAQNITDQIRDFGKTLTSAKAIEIWGKRDLHRNAMH